MKSRRPYLLRALYDWIVDSGEIPNILVDAEIDGVVVPQEHVQDGQIVLNISPQAVRNLNLGDEYVMCEGRFSGRSMELVLPIVAYERSIVEILGKVLPLTTKICIRTRRSRQTWQRRLAVSGQLTLEKKTQKARVQSQRFAWFRL